MPRIFKCFLLLLALPAAAADLPAPVAAALRQAGVPRASVGVVVQELGAPRPSVALNAGASLNPASVMKVITTYAALELLGPAYRWKTEVLQAGDDLVLRGYGDPKLNHEAFWMLLRNLRGRGLREIRGDVLLDRGHFAPTVESPFDSEAFRPYNVTPDALLVNFKSQRFVFVPESGYVRVFTEPSLPGLEIVNFLRVTANGACPEGRAFRELIGADFQPEPPRASFMGLYPVSCGERDFNVAMHAPEAYLEGLLRALWSELGGQWAGKVRNAPTPAEAQLLYKHESPPLGEIVRDINKFSNNVMSRQLYLTLAAEMGGAPARAENARHAIRQWLDSKKIAAPELVLDNGSGLSRVERASALTIAAVLQAAWRSPVMPEFFGSLPLVAVDGTMRKRLLGAPVAGHAHIKSGLLQDARSMAGTVLDRHGRRHVVVMLVNHPRAHDAEPAFDALLGWVYEGARSRGHSRGRPREPVPPGSSR